MANSLNTITVDGVTQTVENYQASKAQAANGDNSTLGKDAFLQLLVTQMKYQDPLDPQDNGEYLAQLAQFSALEQMTNVSEGLSDVSKLVGNIDTSVLVGQLSNMIGKDVQWITESSSTDENGKTITNKETFEGKVTGVSISDGSPTVIAESGGKTYQVGIGNISRIGEGMQNS
ncbi:flagellar basal-body rod modification protein FlgD [Selenomonas ruminantium]|uniref:Flagellar basal-body rod modification protein FlgD n=1 Tax=Selenomonas ruminantium TaxID=971 RepID=A0A1M6R7V1_SELRU|nr:flagellar hook capping FlgD N-terminal domain-containing protein [Selenomonas ruminantium]SHK28534.1 flagellar basal-body rod modification protein FlgD [Selenomonas ruminantium]